MLHIKEIPNNITTTEPSATGSKTFTCFVGKCKQEIDINPLKIAEHINACHPKLSQKFGHAKYVNVCFSCLTYSKQPHHHCFECEHPENGGKPTFFKTKQERNEHLKSFHQKWWFEIDCKFGKECRGIKGGCGFNHSEYPHTFISNTDPIPRSVCCYDKPWEGIRCYRDKCPFDHFWGRVRFLIESRAKQSAPCVAYEHGTKLVKPDANPVHHNVPFVDPAKFKNCRDYLDEVAYRCAATDFMEIMSCMTRCDR